ncbi:MAG: hypothetical protein EAZ55_00790 [Cytophagales bacterium]|nr:MAG: hypothetical protein EAZ55_00790 [Cytophagales bacterium]
MSKQQELRDRLRAETKILLLEEGKPISVIKDYWREQKANMYDIMFLTRLLKEYLLPYQEIITPLLFEGVTQEEIVAKLKEAQPCFSDQLIKEIIEAEQNAIVEDAQMRLRDLIVKRKPLKTAMKIVASKCYNEKQAKEEGIAFIDYIKKRNYKQLQNDGISIMGFGGLFISVSIIVPTIIHILTRVNYIAIHALILSPYLFMWGGAFFVVGLFISATATIRLEDLKQNQQS